jgi:hypothetical protein
LKALTLSTPMFALGKSIVPTHSTLNAVEPAVAPVPAATLAKSVEALTASRKSPATTLSTSSESTQSDEITISSPNLGLNASNTSFARFV